MDKNQLELNALLEISFAINNTDISEESLYKILYFTCISNLNVEKMLLYVLEDGDYKCIVQHNTNEDFKAKHVPEKLKSYDKICYLEKDAKFNGFEQFDVLIPVKHKDQVIALVFVGGKTPFKASELEELNFIQTISNITMVAVENKRLAHEKMKQEMINKELDIARKVQSMLFPSKLPENDFLSIEASYLPHRSVGGDYYDFFELPGGKYLICIADVSGKGVPAAILMSNFQAALRTLSRTTTNLVDIVIELNRLLVGVSKGERFITFFGGIYDPITKEFRYVNAGHNSPFYLENESLKMLEEGTTILGAFDDLPFVNEGCLKIGQGATFFAYTDGVTEATNSNNEQFGEERLSDYLKTISGVKIEEMNEKVIAFLADFRKEEVLNDDLTLLSCRFH